MSHSNINTSRRDMSERDQDARLAGEVIYGSISREHSTSGLLGTGQYSEASLPEDDTACCGIMSPVRRTFCLLAAFDLILIFIIWLIYTRVRWGDVSFSESMAKDVVHYDFHSSLFDHVLCAGWRCVPLLLAYGLFRISHPWTVAATTLGSTVFLIVKVVMFHWSNTNALAYVLFLSSLIIAWAEAWFLDFKVLPRENKARERRRTYLNQDFRGSGSYGNQRRPLWNDAESERYQSLPESPAEPDDDGKSEFRSLPGTRGHSRQHSRGSLALSLGTEEQEYLQKALDAWDRAWEILNSDDWKRNAGTDLDSGLVSSMSYPKIGKLFKLEALVECSPQFCFEEMVLRVEDTATWNPTLLDCKILQTLNENTDICYNVAAEGAGGLVASRDFVNLRHWKSRDNIILSAGCAVGHPDAPPGKKYVRGENGPGGWIFKPIPGRPNACVFCWILNTDLKGWIPQYAVDQALSRMLLEFLGHLRIRVANLTIEQQ